MGWILHPDPRRRCGAGLARALLGLRCALLRLPLRLLHLLLLTHLLLALTYLLLSRLPMRREGLHPRLRARLHIGRSLRLLRPGLGKGSCLGVGQACTAEQSSGAEDGKNGFLHGYLAFQGKRAGDAVRHRPGRDRGRPAYAPDSTGRPIRGS